MVEVLPLPHSCGLLQFAVAVELERERRTLGGGEMSALQRREDDVLELVCRVEDPHRDFFEAELFGGCEPLPPVQDGSRGGDLERLDDPALANVLTERQPDSLLQRRQLRVPVRPQPGERA